VSVEYTKLANTDLIVSRLAFGGEPLGGADWGKVDEAQAEAAVERALELGINFFDTADVYGLGRAEERLARALGHKRHEVVIVSKFGVNWEVDPQGGRARTFLDASPRRVVEALEKSLRRLHVDCLPLYLIHWPDPNTPLADTLEALEKCRQAGKVRYIGVSNFPAPLIREAHRRLSLGAVEFSYNLLQHRTDAEVLTCCQELGLSGVAYGCLAQGLLTGKYGAESRFDEGDRRHRLQHFQGETLRKNLEIVERVKQMSTRYDKSPAQLAIQWVLETPAIACAIVGAKSPVQMDDNAGATGWQMARDDWCCLADGKGEHNNE